MDPRALIIALYVAGLALPVYGAIAAWYRARTTLARHSESIATYTALLKAESVEQDELGELVLGADEVNRRAAEISARYATQVRALGLEPTTWGNIDTVGERAVEKAIRLVSSGNLGNAVIVALGLIAGTVASIWALYLPPA